MFTPLRVLLFCTTLILSASAFAQINIVNFDFGAVGIACGGYAYEGAVIDCPYGYPTQNFTADPGFGWILGHVVARQVVPTTLEGGAGLTAPSSNFSPPPFAGLPFSQAVFLQDRGSFVWQGVSFAAGTYALSFYLGSRYTSGGFDGDQTVAALIDGQVVGTWALSSYTPFTLETAVFTASNNGTHTVEFMGMRPGDHTAFLSYVVITPNQNPVQ